MGKLVFDANQMNDDYHDCVYCISFEINYRNNLIGVCSKPNFNQISNATDPVTVSTAAHP